MFDSIILLPDKNYVFMISISGQPSGKSNSLININFIICKIKNALTLYFTHHSYLIIYKFYYNRNIGHIFAQCFLKLSACLCQCETTNINITDKRKINIPLFINQKTYGIYR